MNQNETGPLPFKKEPKHEDPFLAAIKKNPRPLSMVVIGMIGMPLILLLTGPDRDAVSAQPPAIENSAQPIERVTPAPLEIVPESPSDITITPEPDLSDASSSALSPLPFHEESVALLPSPILETPIVTAERPSIALIIDDIGYNAALGDRPLRCRALSLSRCSRTHPMARS